MASLLAGFARAPITPRESLRMGGYPLTSSYVLAFLKHRPSQGVHDDLFARCLALSDGTTTLVLVSLDLLAFFGPDVAEVRRRAYARLPAAQRDQVQIWVGCTHSHAGPDTYGVFGGVPARYKEYVAEQAAGAVAAAVAALQPARLATGSLRMKGALGNFRDPDRGHVDPEVSVLYIRTAAGAPLVTLVNLACHPNILWKDNRLISADFPGALCDYLAAHDGGEGIFFNGAVGDIYTAAIARDFHNEKGQGRTHARVREFGEEIGRQVLAAVPPDADFAAAVPIRPVRGEARIPVENKQLLLLRRIGVIKRELPEGRFHAELGRLDLGDATLVTVPAQIFAALGQELRDAFSGRRLFMLGLTNDEMSYVLPPEIFRWGGRQERISLGPQTWSHLKAAILELPPGGGA